MMNGERYICIYLNSLKIYFFLVRLKLDKSMIYVTKNVATVKFMKARVTMKIKKKLFLFLPQLYRKINMNQFYFFGKFK